MSIAHTLSDLAEQLDAAVATVDPDSLSAEDATTLLPAFASLQRHINTFVSYTEARTKADNVHFLDQRTRTTQQLASTQQAEEAAFSVAEFAMVSGDNYTGGEIVTSTWEDGRHFEWIGSQCIVSND